MRRECFLNSSRITFHVRRERLFTFQNMTLAIWPNKIYVHQEFKMSNIMLNHLLYTISPVLSLYLANPLCNKSATMSWCGICYYACNKNHRNKIFGIKRSAQHSSDGIWRQPNSHDFSTDPNSPLAPSVVHHTPLAILTTLLKQVTVSAELHESTKEFLNWKQDHVLAWIYKHTCTTLHSTTQDI